MNVRKFILRETALLALGELVCSAAIVGVFAMLGQFSYKVILGAVIGTILAVGNFFFMAIASNAVADRTIAQGEGEDTVKQGKAAMKSSYGLRMLVIAVLLFVFAKTGHCNLIAMICPLFLILPIIMVIEFFRKSGEQKV
jgi:hypothetical protein